MEPGSQGWLPDPNGGHRVRWRDETGWTRWVSAYGKVWKLPLPLESDAKRRRPWLWVALAGISLLVLLLLPQLVTLLALIVLITAIVGLARGGRTWLRLNTRKATISTIVAASAVMLVAGSVNAATNSSRAPSEVVVASVPSAGDDGSSVSPIATSAPQPTPQRTIREVSVTEVIDFDSTTVDDAALPAGQTAIAVQGVNGERRLTYEVTYENNQEINRELVSETVSIAPVTQVTVNGTYVAPPPPPPVSNGCDPNYADACVPIAGDVDCAWGTGNGPAYFSGVARVVGSDIYGLDRDGDGYACER